MESSHHAVSKCQAFVIRTVDVILIIIMAEGLLPLFANILLFCFSDLRPSSLLGIIVKA